MWRIAVVFVLSLLGGCASDSGRIPEDYSDADRGWLVLSMLTTNDNRFRNTFLRIRSKDGSRNTFVQYTSNRIAGDFGAPINSRQPRDFDTANENGNVLVRPLPAGDYEIYSFSAAGWGWELEPPTDFSIPFSIQAGSASYIGSFKVHPIFGTNILGTSNQPGMFFVVTDETERDLAVARSKSAGIGSIQSVVPNVDQIGSPAFRRSADIAMP